jgi:hypothetical protein
MARRMRWLTLTLLIGITSSAVWNGYRRRLGRNVLLGLTLLAALWALAALAVSTDWRDADGYVDCWPNCSPLQDTVGVLFVVAPAAAVFLALSALVTWLIRRRKGV